jgi:hypothetical protein
MLVTVSPACLTRSGKRRLETDVRAGHQFRSTQRRGDKATVNIPHHIHTVRFKHKGTIQPIQNTDCTTGQAHCTVVGMEIIQNNLFKKYTKH